MTAHTRSRIAAIVGVLVAPLALVAASTSAGGAAPPPAKHKHEMVQYKVESTVKLAGTGTDTVGDSPNQSLSCNPGDYVLDGMWLVKHVDQYPALPPDPDDPDLPGVIPSGDERDVWVQASHPRTGDLRTWDFVFANRAYGDAQLRLAITCINGTTQYTNGHRHDVRVRFLWDGGPVAPINVLAGRFDVVRGGCSPNEYFVAPGFDLGAVNFANNYRLVGSYPLFSATGWTWEFGSWPPPGMAPDPVSVWGRCIERRVFDGLTPQHWIAMAPMPSPTWVSFANSFVPPGGPFEVKYQCDQDNVTMHNYKAMVGWFWMGDHWQNNWFLGMEPRPKLRAFTFWNNHVNPVLVKYGTLCINSRTSNPI